MNNVSWRMDRSSAGSGSLFFTQLSGPDWLNPTNYTWDANSIGWHERNSQDKQWTTRLDLRNKLSGSVPVTVKYGLWSNLEARDVHRYGLLTTDIRGADGTRGTADDNPAGYVDTGFSPDWGWGGNLNGIAVLSPWKLYQTYVAHPDWFVDNGVANLQQRLQNNWNFKEQIDAAYLQPIFKFGKLEIAPGVRYERTRNFGRGAKVLGDKDPALASLTPGTPAFVIKKYGSKISAGHTYSNTLGYLHASYDLSRNITLRAAFHQAITRADVSNLIPGISSVDFDNQILSASNPALKPEKSNNFNLGFEYYFEPVGAFSVSFFQFNVKDRQFGTQEYLGASGFEGDPTYAGWRVNWVNNVGNTLKQRGFEIDYQQQLSFIPALKGLGVFANYTASRFDDWGFWAGVAQVSANAGLTYDRGKFMSRLNGNWVGRQLQTVGRSYNLATNTWAPAAPFAPEYQAARLLVDLNLEYRLTRAITVFADARNLFNEPTISTYRAVPDDFLRKLRTGTVWMVGLKGRF